MRKDMHRLLCERPRIHSDAQNRNSRSSTRKARSRGTLNELPRKESVRKTGKTFGRRWNYLDRKELNEYLNPLRRFLESRVGHHWDDVYSEVRENIRLDTAVHLHIMQHLYDYVEVHVTERNGKVCYKNGRRWYRDLSELSDGAMYVCPSSGVLKMYRRKRSTPRKKWDYRTHVKLTKDAFLYKHMSSYRPHKGTWWMYQFEWVPWEWPADEEEHLLQLRRWPSDLEKWARSAYKKWGHDLVIKDKWKLSKKEREKYGLSNG